MDKKDESQHENVRVICRVRPMNRTEEDNGAENCVKITTQCIDVRYGDVNPEPMYFDKVFGPRTAQKDVFDDSVLPLIKDVLSGYNATVFAYGQSGSGKTHTMEGKPSDADAAGIIPRAIDEIFRGMASLAKDYEFQVSASFVEIYMEKIHDLLDDSGVNVNLSVRQDTVKGIFVEGVTEEVAATREQLLALMSRGSKNRAVAATGLNEGSSRSHSLFTVNIMQRDRKESSTVLGKLVLVDLAGSESNDKSKATGQQLEEAKLINKSLSALGQVINALTDPKATHIPYRDSKLTRILQNSLGGNSKTVLIVACSPSSFNAGETLNALRFGTRAKNISNKVKLNRTRTIEELEVLLGKTVEAMTVHISNLSAQLQALHNEKKPLGDNSVIEQGETLATVLLEKLQEKLSEVDLELEVEQKRHNKSSKHDEWMFSLDAMGQISQLQHQIGELEYQLKEQHKVHELASQLVIDPEWTQYVEDLHEELDQSRDEMNESMNGSQSFSKESRSNSRRGSARGYNSLM